MLSTDQIYQLQETLEAAGKRREAAAIALAPKHKGGEWEEFHAAVKAELVAERALAAAQNQAYAVPVELPVLWDTGAPLPHLLQNDYQAFLIFFVRDADPSWDGSSVNIRRPDSPAAFQLAVVEFKGCVSTMMGSPNDEVLHGHPLYGKGLEGYRPMRIENSAWIAELQRINSVHDGYAPERWRRLSHYFFGFHDVTFECVAESVSVDLHESSLPEVLAKVCERLLR
ncbi:hypothetical protein [Massilia aquatica]|uniref:Uncharacterized protein n=1 Tax=Massilia aquatica TaxID=2609000 RepID=A0ABX0MEE3_9BURK|nr:hypothetical protein [Massilia aquatica]NHZ42632.1 hypothetical protein [Massilia aquatica]